MWEERYVFSVLRQCIEIYGALKMGLGKERENLAVTH